METPVSKDLQDLLVVQDHRAPQDHLEHQDLLDLLVHRELQDNQELLD
jgi:hypothetical protein